MFYLPCLCAVTRSVPFGAHRGLPQAGGHEGNGRSARRGGARPPRLRRARARCLASALGNLTAIPRSRFIRSGGVLGHRRCDMRIPLGAYSQPPAGLATVFGEVTVTRMAYRALRRRTCNRPTGAQPPEEKHSHGLRRLAAVESAVGLVRTGRQCGGTRNQRAGRASG